MLGYKNEQKPKFGINLHKNLIYTETSYKSGTSVHNGNCCYYVNELLGEQGFYCYLFHSFKNFLVTMPWLK